MQALFRGHALGRVDRGVFGQFRRDMFKMLDKTLQRIRAAVEDQIFGELFLTSGDVSIRCDMRRINNGHIQAGLYAVIQHDRIQHRAGLRRQTKGKIRDAQRSQHTRQILLDKADSLHGLNRRVGEFGVACGQGEGKSIEDQRFRAQAMLGDSNLIDSSSHFQFACGSFCHTTLVNGQYDNSGIISFCQGKNLIGLGAASFEVGGIDETTPGGSLEGCFEYIQFGRVNHQWHVHAHLQFLDHFAHQRNFVRTLGYCSGYIQGMCAKGNLLACDLENCIVILLEQQALELLAPLGITTFPDQERRRILLHTNSGYGRRQAGSWLIRAGRMVTSAEFLDQKF